MRFFKILNAFLGCQHSLFDCGLSEIFPTSGHGLVERSTDGIFCPRLAAAEVGMHDFLLTGTLNVHPTFNYLKRCSLASMR